MRKGQGRWHVLYGKTGKPRHLDANVEKGGRSGILCPVTPPGAPRLCPILSSWCPPTRWTKQNTIPTSFRRHTTYLSPPFLSLLRGRRTSRRRRLRSRLYTRNRNSAATRKCLAFLRPVQSPEDVILSPLFRTWNAYRYDTRQAWIHGHRVIDVFGEEEKCDCNLSFFPDDSTLEELLSHGVSRWLSFCLCFAIDLPFRSI